MGYLGGRILKLIKAAVKARALENCGASGLAESEKGRVKNNERQDILVGIPVGLSNTRVIQRRTEFMLHRSSATKELKGRVTVGHGQSVCKARLKRR